MIKDFGTGNTTTTKQNKPLYVTDRNNKVKQTDKKEVFTNSFTAEQIYTEGKKTLKNNDYFATSLIRKGRFTIFYGEAGAGKSIFARQIAEAIAQGENIFDLDSLNYTETSAENVLYKLENKNPPTRVLYYDLEMSAEQLFGRYSIDGKTTGYPFSENIITKFPTYESEEYFNAFEEDMKAGIADVYIIDNASVIGFELEDGERAKKFMIRFKRLINEYNATIILLAHTPKRYKYQPIDLNNLAGSAKIGVFVDDCFSIAVTPSGLYYLKHQKTRSNQRIFDENNVIVVDLIQNHNNGFLGFKFVGYDSEVNILKDSETSELDEAIKDRIFLKDKTGKTIENSQTSIADDLYQHYGNNKKKDTFRREIARKIKRIKGELGFVGLEELKKNAYLPNMN
ncbi:MAG: AAA family ATPase [Bacteroidales bacterium]|jgi:archaellum biogenesis ATPase FlaH